MASARYLGVVVAALAAVSPAAGSRAQTVRWTRLWHAPVLPVEIPVGDSPQRVRLSLPPASRRPGHALCLRFAARLHTLSPSGWNHYLLVSLNGIPLTPLGPDRKPRALNLPPFLQADYPGEPRVPIFANRVGGLALVTLFGPDFTTLDPRIRTGREEGCWYLLDVSDLVSPSRPNTLELANLALRSYWGNSPPPGMRMVVDHLEMGRVPTADVERMRGVHLARRRPLPGPTVRRGDLALTGAPGGGLQIEMLGERAYLETALSYASPRRIGHNAWRCLARASGEPGWRPSVRRLGSRALEVVCQGRSYRLTRRVVLAGSRVEVSDTLRNKTDEVIGVRLRHELLTPDFPRAHRLSGLREAAVAERRYPENPTAYVAQRRTALGLVMEENALRLQMGSEVQGNTLRLSFDHLGLPPRGYRVLKWALYPLPLGRSDPDAAGYFRFVNAVRRDWRVNFTVPGGFEFVVSQETLGPEGERMVRALVERKGVRLFALTPWFEYYSQAEMSRDEYRTLIQNAMRAIKRVRPDALCLALLESNLTPVPITFFGDTLPADTPYGPTGTRAPFGKAPGVYGLPAPPAATRRVEATDWRDSVLRDAQGNVLLDTWYVGNYGGRALNLMVYPTLDNSWHRRMLDKIRFVLDEVGCDGVYFDQFSFAYGLADRFTADRWDGCTVDVDPTTGHVVGKYADLGLLTAPARVQWVREVLRRGKVVVANSMPAVMEEQALPIFRFMETQGYDAMSAAPPEQPVCAKGHLASPIGLGHMWSGEPARIGAPFFTRTVAAHLRHGLLYYYYGARFPPDGEGGGEYGVVPHMFPLTPVGLGEGFIVGRERVVTCVSGVFERPQARRPVARLFDERGRPLVASADRVRVTGRPGRWQVWVRLRDWWQTAVIE